MANGNLGSYAVTLPNVFQAPGQALQSATEQVQRQGENLAQMQMRQQEIAERKAERDEAQLYRKMQTIQELSDLSKYQTANDVANAIGNKNAFEIRKKYIDLARQGKVNDADIFEGINKEIASTAQGMNALKAEGENFENELKNLKQIMPKLDAPRLLRDYRKDVVNRRIEDGVSFKNPLEVQQSEFATNLLDPDNLSDYLTDISDLEKQVVSPKSVREMNLAVGSSKDFVPFEGKVPFFAEAVLPEGYIEGDYLPKGFVPETRVKSEIIPEIKKLTGLDFKVVPDDVYNNFADDPIGKTNVIALAKQKFPTYKNFTPVEKYNAQKNALYDYITQKNVSGFTSKERKVKADTNINIPKEGTPTVDLWSGIKNLVESKKEGFATPFNELPAKTQGIILEFARDASGKGKDELNQTNIVLKKNPQGEIAVYKYDNKKQLLGNMIVPLSEQDVNIEAQATAAGKTQAIKDTGKTEPKSQGQTYSSEIEAKIGNVLKANPGASRQDVINALKKEGKIK
jgi:hypothetical protein